MKKGHKDTQLISSSKNYVSPAQRLQEADKPGSDGKPVLDNTSNGYSPPNKMAAPAVDLPPPPPNLPPPPPSVDVKRLEGAIEAFKKENAELRSQLNELTTSLLLPTYQEKYAGKVAHFNDKYYIVLDLVSLNVARVYSIGDSSFCLEELPISNWTVFKDRSEYADDLKEITKKLIATIPELIKA